jgi:hypothetical protein
MRYRKSIFMVVSLFSGLAALVSECSNSVNMAGTATQSGNGMIVGMVVFGNGAPANGSPVRLRKSDFDPVGCSDTCFSRNAIADGAGRYAFDAIPVDTYTIEASNASGWKTLRFGTIVSARSTVTLIADTLKDIGTLKVHVPDSLIHAGGYVYVPGTDIQGYFDSIRTEKGYMEIDSVPAVTLPWLYFRIPGSPKISVDTNTVRIFEHDTTETEIDADDTLDADLPKSR